MLGDYIRFYVTTSMQPVTIWSLFCPGATKDMGKMLGGEEEKDPDAAKKEEERQEALRQQEEERKAKHARMEAEREKVRQTIRDKVRTHVCLPSALASSQLPKNPAFPFHAHPVRAQEEGRERGGGEGSYGAGLRGLADPSQEGHPQGLRRRGGGGRGEHPRHRAQVPARTATGHVQEVKAAASGKPHTSNEPEILGPVWPGPVCGERCEEKPGPMGSF